MLTYQEANLFLRAGDDMRFDGWPPGDFIRITVGSPYVPEGYEVREYVPSEMELSKANWRRA